MLDQDVSLINEEDLHKLGVVDIAISCWLCQKHSKATIGQGFGVLGSILFSKLVRDDHWRFHHLAIPLDYILKNVPPLDDIHERVTRYDKYLDEVFMAPTILHAIKVGSFFQCPRRSQ